MRISTAWSYQRAVNTLLERRSGIAHTQRQLSTGKRILAPADDPVGATQVLGLDRAVASTSQFESNIGVATDRLHYEEQALGSVGDILVRVRQLALEANNASQTNATRADIAVEMRQRIDQLRQIANSRDGRGEYIFAGYSTHTLPFSKQGGGIEYQGDAGERLFQIGPSQQIAAGDTGAAVFVDIPDGNGTFSVTPNAANSGSGIVGSTSVTDASAYDDGTYTLEFSAADSYEVRDGNNDVVASGHFESGQTIGFRGIELTVKGAPAAGDQFVVAQSADQSVFATLDTLADALETPANDAASKARLHNAINASLENIDQAHSNILQTRARVGGRLNVLSERKSLNADYVLQLKSRAESIEGVDYAAAASRLTLQKTVLQAAQQAFVKVQGLSLFNFIR